MMHVGESLRDEFSLCAPTSCCMYVSDGFSELSSIRVYIMFTFGLH